MASSTDPEVVIYTRQFVVIEYGDQKIHMPADKAVDLIKPIATLLPGNAPITK